MKYFFNYITKTSLDIRLWLVLCIKNSPDISRRVVNITFHQLLIQNAFEKVSMFSDLQGIKYFYEIIFEKCNFTSTTFLREVQRRIIHAESFVFSMAENNFPVEI